MNGSDKQVLKFVNDGDNEICVQIEPSGMYIMLPVLDSVDVHSWGGQGPLLVSCGQLRDGTLSLRFFPEEGGFELYYKDKNIEDYK